MSWIVACGLRREAALMARGAQGLRIIAGGGEAQALERGLEQEIAQARGVIVSSGIAGALASSLRCGDVVVDGEETICQRLSALLPSAIRGPITGSDTMVTRQTDKAALHRKTDALAVDMETQVARRVADRHGLPFVAIRVISDEAGDTLPPAALVGMKPDGTMALGAVLASLARRPAQLPALLRTGRQAGRAFRTLAGCYDTLGRSGIFRLDLGEFPLKMA